MEKHHVKGQKKINPWIGAMIVSRTPASLQYVLINIDCHDLGKWIGRFRFMMRIFFICLPYKLKWVRRGSRGWAVRGGERDKTLTCWVLRWNRGLGLDLMRYNVQIPLAIPVFLIRNMGYTFFNITHENDLRSFVVSRSREVGRRTNLGSLWQVRLKLESPYGYVPLRWEWYTKRRSYVWSCLTSFPSQFFVHW